MQMLLYPQTSLLSCYLNKYHPFVLEVRSDETRTSEMRIWSANVSNIYSDVWIFHFTASIEIETRRYTNCALNILHQIEHS